MIVLMDFFLSDLVSFKLSAICGPQTIHDQLRSFIKAVIDFTSVALHNKVEKKTVD